MEESKKIIFFALRHGDSEAMKEGVIASNPTECIENYGLTQNGRKQACNAACHFFEQKKEDLLNHSAVCVRVISSDFKRAAETAALFTETLNDLIKKNLSKESEERYNPINVTHDILLRERYFGEYDKTPIDNYQKIWTNDEMDESQEICGVESCIHVAERARNLINRCSKEATSFEKQFVIFVSHGDTLQIMSTLFNSLSPGKHRHLPHLPTAELRTLGEWASKD
ncbi:putative phosphoglycerate mutase [Monocercomonoides exilis]|uniref:putative phosphoglycerate mutase n=1 Tax=Monocercomonoides exilis TaxID=2049356 RepID=UPI003559CC4E|nr:putative phosphoglycerate mutase [Monocercomonoides exilis]|eukprot:MONOS_5734.1-p1 / transcript=MONOS_5734.1 / gene=MONOS_5734 / organism=Monocercomonoides_exilis_PA203 / gene_product=phosphoglycerate mutase / transcript_product=phosphoglycerate mutase / location=Mono_scaffold00171:64812-65623(+) / protein_length=225 / sequence_SO=supercontig / SO=protein_coding / is_pseudo=false